MSAQYGLEVDPERHVHSLSVGERQRVEIVPAGKTLNDDEEHQINGFAEGVAGSLPKQ